MSIARCRGELEVHAYDPSTNRMESMVRAERLPSTAETVRLIDGRERGQVFYAGKTG